MPSTGPRQRAGKLPNTRTAPFRPVGKDFPRIIRVQESWSADNERVRRFLLENGAISKASPPEREAIQSVAKGKYVKARELAEKILQDQPESIPALLALAEVYHKGEAHLPRALFHVRQVRKLLHRRGLANPDDGDSREWYLRALELEYHILRDLDQAENQLRVVQLIEQLYEPLPWLKVWPLFKCKRLDEAEEALQQCEKTGRWRLHSLNSRCALEEQRGRRVPTYEAGLLMTKAIPGSAVLWSNLGGAAQYAFLQEEAKSAYLKAVKLPVDFHGTAYRSLALLYLQQGRFPAALDALKKGQKQRAQRKAHTLQQDQTKMDRTIGLLLLALGKSEQAARFTQRAILKPDRTGSTTDDETALALTNGLVYWTVLCSQLEEGRENHAAKSGLKQFDPSAAQQALEFQIWTHRQKLLKILQDPKRLNVLRPYMPGQSEAETWLLGGLLQILPSGVAEEACCGKCGRRKTTRPPLPTSTCDIRHRCYRCLMRAMGFRPGVLKGGGPEYGGLLNQPMTAFVAGWRVSDATPTTDVFHKSELCASQLEFSVSPFYTD